MSEFRDRLDLEAQRISPAEDAIDRVRRRAGALRRTRRVASGAVALAIMGGGIALAYSAFRTPDGGRPLAGPPASPTPGPTPTNDEETPDPIAVQIDDATTVPGASGYAVFLLASEGRAAHHGGYDVLELRDTEGSEVTVLFCDPRYEHEALRLRDLFFPGAEIRVQLPDDPIAVRIVLGQDFATREAPEIESYQLVSRFLEARQRGAGARSYLSDDAALDYAEGNYGGLSLYEYAEMRESAITGVFHAEDEVLVVVVRFDRTNTYDAYERLTVGDRDPVDGVPEILAAERNA